VNIYQRINEVRKEVPYVRKDAAVQGYKAVSHDQLTARLHDSLVRHGVIIVPSLMSEEIVEAGKTAKGAVIIRYQCIVEVAFINMDEPSDVLKISMPAHANDHGDKAPGKAMSYAVKYAMLKVFSLESGDQEESRVESDRAMERISQDDVETLRGRMKDIDISENDEKFSQYLKGTLKVSKIEDLNYNGLKAVYTAMNRFGS